MSADAQATVTVGGPSRAALTQIAPGAAISDWRVSSLVAIGGHAAVYRVEHATRGTPAAIKVLRDGIAESSEMLARFAREIDVVRSLRHANVVEVLDVGRLADGRPWFAMEFLEGQDLARLLRARRRLSAAECLQLLSPVCDALALAHAQGVIHRDVKASNVFVAADGTVKLLDFGIAKLLGQENGGALTTAGERLGTAHAMSPEQITSGVIDARTDVYALGILLHEMLTGLPPFVADDAFELERLHLESPAPAPSRIAPVSATVDAVVVRALEKVPERRFPDVTSFREALREAVSGRCGSDLVPAVFVRVALERDVRDDESVAAASECMDDVEARLSEAGFDLPLRAANAVLAVRILPSDGGEAETARRDAATLAHDITCTGLRATVYIASAKGPASMNEVSR